MPQIKKKIILIVFGTRPEAIKMCPLVYSLREKSEYFDVQVCSTGQHKEMLTQVLDIFNIKPDYNLDIMQKGQDLYDVTNRVLLGMRGVLNKSKPDLVLVHGDTTTSMATSLASYYQQIPVGHVEAGLRTYNIYSPWPEEINRQITGRIATYHFAPTELSKNNLVHEGIDENQIFITGNTVITALKMVLNKINNDSGLQLNISKGVTQNGYDIQRLTTDKQLVLITGHRRENFGEGFVNICESIKLLGEKYPDVDFIYPVHPNPNVREPIEKKFGNTNHSNVFFIAPLEYLSFVFLMEKCTLILTDSGGVQEEAPGLGKPVLVMRNTTERPEAVIAGTVKLVGTDKEKIVSEVSRLLEDKDYYNSMSETKNPYGDGSAAEQIAKILMTVL